LALRLTVSTIKGTRVKRGFGHGQLQTCITRQHPSFKNSWTNSWTTFRPGSSVSSFCKAVRICKVYSLGLDIQLGAALFEHHPILQTVAGRACLRITAFPILSIVVERGLYIVTGKLLMR
jgi:hypothetical protein